MESTPKKILVFSGPSGGHLFPAQAFAEAAQEENFPAKLILVTSVRAKTLCSGFPDALFSEIRYLPEFGAPSLFSSVGIKAIFKIPAAAIQSWKVISQTKPDLCIGFGSFVSYFGVLFSAWRGIPTLIHEQNQVPGKATRMLQGVARKTATSFPETAFKKKTTRAVFTGLPIRRELREGIIPVQQKVTQPFTVLVCGGSQGSAFLNAAVIQAFSIFSPEERSQFAVIHIAGEGQEKEVREQYARLQMTAEVFPFFQEMRLIYNRAQMVISRAGANSLFEQALYGLPTALIPYPHAEGHQQDNASYFVEKGGAFMHIQNEASSGWIAAVLKEWVSQPQSYWNVSRNMLALAQTTGHALVLVEAKKTLKSKS